MPPGDKATVDCILQFEAGVNIFVKVNRTLKSLGNHCDIYVIIQAHFSGCYVHLYSTFAFSDIFVTVYITMHLLLNLVLCRRNWFLTLFIGTVQVC